MENNSQDALENLFVRSTLPAQQVPELDLYMDQIITLIQQGLSENCRSEDEKILTKTMINNYSKDKLLKPIKGKKYSKEHILMLLLIYHLKQNLSITDIKRFLDTMATELSGEEEGRYHSAEVRQTYDAFSAMQLQQKERLPQYVRECLSRMPEAGSQEEETRRLFLTLTCIAEAASSAAQELLDQTAARAKPEKPAVSGKK